MLDLTLVTIQFFAQNGSNCLNYPLCDIFKFVPKFYKKMLVKTLGPKGIELLDLPLCDFLHFRLKTDKTAGLTPCNIYNCWFKNGKNCWTCPLVIYLKKVSL